jgi:phosphatidate phosphatase LPIN
VKSELFLWSEDSKVVVIDVEGAITANRRGSSWTSFLSGTKSASIHEGVAALLQNIADNGYHILYIAQNAASTKDQLQKIVGEVKGRRLPPGPVIHSPDCLMPGSNSNTSHTRTDVFKLAVLRGLKSLFPASACPYYASFGTKASDTAAFSRAGVPEGRIFTVDETTGDIRSVNRTMRRSFDDFNRFVNEMFPPYAGENS